MDHEQVIKWLVPIVARGLAWIFASWLGLAAAESGDLATKAAGGLGALALVGVSIYTSIKGRRKLEGAAYDEGIADAKMEQSHGQSQGGN